MEVPEGEGCGNGVEQTFEEITGENFPKLTKYPLMSPSLTIIHQDQNQTRPGHIGVNLLTTKGER
jgi:hypothetical protein